MVRIRCNLGDEELLYHGRLLSQDWSCCTGAVGRSLRLGAGDALPRRIEIQVRRRRPGSALRSGWGADYFSYDLCDKPGCLGQRCMIARAMGGYRGAVTWRAVVVKR